MKEEELLEDRVKLFEDLADTLSKVTDERTAKDHYAHVQEIESRLKNNKTRVDKLHREKIGTARPPNEISRKKMEKSLREAIDRVIAEYQRIQTDHGGASDLQNEVQFTLNQQGINPLPPIKNR